MLNKMEGFMMKIGKKIKNLRLKKGLTQEELGERTDLSKGYISQLERDLSSPSIDTFFNILEVLGCTPKEFFDEEEREQKVVYGEEDQTDYLDEERGYKIQWLVPESNEKEMEPIRAKAGEAIYYHASDEHQILNDAEGRSRLVLVATESYL